MAGVKCKCFVTIGSHEMIEADLTAALGTISVASGTVPSLAILGDIAGRSHIVIIYQEA
jgi:hypothetical protein